MSLILDALKKSESDRKENPTSRGSVDVPDDENERPLPWRAIVLASLTLVIIAALGAVKFMSGDAPPVETAQVEAVPEEAPRQPEPAKPEPVTPEAKQMTVPDAVKETPPEQLKPEVAKKPDDVAKVISPPVPKPAPKPTPKKTTPKPKAVITKLSVQPTPPAPPQQEATVKAAIKQAEPSQKTPPAEPIKLTPPVKPAVPKQAPVSSSANLARQHLDRAEQYEKDGNIDLAIEEYGKAILRNNRNPEAYYARGWMHEANRSFESAIKDFSQAISLKKGFADAFFARAWVFEQTGRIGSAISDYSNVIDLEPGHMNATLSRGILRLYSNQPAQSGGDFRTVFENADSELSDYGLLWLYVTRLRISADPQSTASEFSAIQPKTDWPGILFRSFTDTASATQVLNSINMSDPLATRKRQCVGYFFLGQHQLALGDTAGARQYFTKTLDSGITTYRQYWAAKLELERLSSAQ
jgi:lipoprotein NlpI